MNETHRAEKLGVGEAGWKMRKEGRARRQKKFSKLNCYGLKLFLKVYLIAKGNTFNKELKILITIRKYLHHSINI